MERVNERNNKKELDIILLNMSTLPQKPRMNSFSTPDGEDVSDCISQLECIVRYILRTTNRDAEIVPLCTAETLKPIAGLTVSEDMAKSINSRWEKEIFKLDEIDNKNHELAEVEDLIKLSDNPQKPSKSFWQQIKDSLKKDSKPIEYNDNWHLESKSPINLTVKSKTNFRHDETESIEKAQTDQSLVLDQEISAFQFFKNQINGCIEKGDKTIYYLNDDPDDPDYQDDYISLSEDNIPAAVRETTNVLRYLFRKYPDSHLYIDTHGGFREFSLVLNAVLSLLKQDGFNSNSKNVKIAPEKIFGVEIGSHKKPRIVDQTETYAIFDFITGMNDFINFGSAKVLNEYYDHFGDHTGRTNQVTNAMNKISDGIQFCSSNLYIQGLNELEQQFENSENESGLDDLFKIFENNIKEDYGELLNPNLEASARSFKIVKWCRENGLYQQALTFAESQMPKYFCMYIVSIQKEASKAQEYEDKRNSVANNKWKDFENQVIDTLISQIGNMVDSFFYAEDKSEETTSFIEKLKDGNELAITELYDTLARNNNHFFDKRQINDFNCKSTKNKIVAEKYVNLINTSCEKIQNDITCKKSEVSKYQQAIEHLPTYNVNNKRYYVKISLKKKAVLSCILLPKNKNEFDEKKFIQLLMIHKEIKDRRNQFNHGDSKNNPNVKELGVLMDHYFDLIDALSSR